MLCLSVSVWILISVLPGIESSAVLLKSAGLYSSESLAKAKMIALACKCVTSCGYDFKMPYLKNSEIDVCDTGILFWEMVKESACVNFGVRMCVVFRKSSIKIRSADF